jgi:beta-lactamase regulating signal transducer with metallopeptidase domain
MNAMLLLKATILLLATLAAARALRRAPAGARHHFWTGAFAGLLVLPVMTAIVPMVHVPVPQSWTTATASRDATLPVSSVEQSGSRTSAPHTTTVVAPSPDAGGQADPGRSFVVRTGDALLVTWLTGVMGAVGALMLSLLRVGRLARSAETEIDPDWDRAAQDLSARLGLRRSPRLLSSPAVTTPMAAGVFRPTIFLPAAATTWTSEQRDIVLAHEIAHLVARDPLRHLLTRLAMAGYWFHPAAWMAAREAALAREQACDEAVLALGTKPSSYARVLLEFADAASAAPPLGAALPIVHPSVLEKRLMAILNGDHRPTPRRVLLVPAAGVALLTLTVAAAHPRAGAPSPRPWSNDGAAMAAVQTPSVTAVRPVVTALARLAGGAGIIEPAAPPQDVAVAAGCGWIRGRSFSGNTTVNDSGGRVVREQVGWSGSDRVIQTSTNDLRMCLVAEGLGAFSENERPSQWMDRAPRIVMETQRSGRVHQLEIVGSGGNRRTTWRIGGAERPFDQAGQQWRTQLLAVLDATWELSMLRGQVSSLRGDISSIEGERSSLRGEISSLQGEVSSMRGHASSILGEESSLRGEISSIRGHVSSLRGEISSQRGAISSLNGHRYSDRDDRLHVDALIAKHEKEIAALEQDIRDYNENARVAAIEKQINELNAAKKVAQIEAEIKAFDLERKIAEIEREIAKLDVEGQAGAVEGKIRGLDADRRGRQLEDRRATELKRLEAAISAIK